jgi:hypothetical protein
MDCAGACDYCGASLDIGADSGGVCAVCDACK